jgi:hypothetical protein
MKGTNSGNAEGDMSVQTRHLELAGEALLAGMTREQAIARLVSG